MKTVKKKGLLLLLFTIFFKQLAWSVFLPLWQTPDEQAHFAQVQNRAELGVDFKPGKNTSTEILISEDILGDLRDSSGNNKFTYHPNYKSDYSFDKENKITSLPKNLRMEFALNEATGYPPLYYQLSSVIYKVFYNGSLFDRVFAIRIFMSLILVSLVMIAYKIGLLIFKDENKSFTLAILVGFQPMLTFVNGGVTSDTLFNLLFGVFIYFCLRLLDSGINLLDSIFILGTIILSYWTKPQANIMVFIFVPLIIYLLIINRQWNYRIIFMAGIMIVVSCFGLIYRLINSSSIFPESDGMGHVVVSFETIFEHIIFTAKHTYSEVLPWFWGVFRWLSLGLPEILRKVTNWLTILSFVGFIFFYLKRPSKKIFFMVFSFLVYFLAISAFDFGFRQSHGFSFGIQGRYFFPVIIPFMVIFMTGLKPVSKYLAIGMIIFNIVVFFWVIGSYYSLNLSTFFIEASQYKPVWLKYPINLLLLSQYLLWSLLLLPLIMKKK